MRFCVAGKQWIATCGVALLLVLQCLVSAAETPSTFEEANRFYEQGKYPEAVERYQNLLQAGRNSAAVFFNLGNAWFKQGKLGQALLNYRKAEALAPRDPDIQANLRFTRERVTDSLSVQRSVWKRTLRYFTLNELAISTTILFWIWAGFFCLRRVRPTLASKLKLATIVAGTLFALSVLTTTAAYVEHNKRIAIVVSKQATVHLGPLPESQSAFVATDGSELLILNERPGWLQVSDRTGRTGWIAIADAAIP